MSLNDSRVAIFNYINSSWADTAKVFEGSSAGDQLIKSDDSWIYSYIVWGGEEQQTMGSSEAGFDTTGVLAINLYVRKDKGMAVFDQHTDNLIALCRRKEINNITFQNPRINNQENDLWLVRSLSFSFIVRTVETIL